MYDLIIRNGTVVDGTGAKPSIGDVAIEDGHITAVGGRLDGSARREIDADGAVVAPGWVDVHTHYDGQAMWDPELSPSIDHGVTTAVMGNCGVGFAPVRPGGENFLVELMEGVEDIPGTALHEGLDWRWETFSQYVDALASTHRTMDIATQVPHAAVRAYVLGDRAHEDDLTADELREMAAVVVDGVRAGALGFSTSRTVLHRSRHGYVPGTFAADDELGVIVDALADFGRGMFQYVNDDRVDDPGQIAWLEHLSARGVPVTYSLAQLPYDPTRFRRALDDAAAHTAAGNRITPQVPPRPTGMLFGLRSSFHPFMAHPSFRAMWDLPLESKVAKLSDPAVRAQLLSEEPQSKQRSAIALATAFHQMYRLGDPPDYEPPREASAAATAERQGRSPQEVVLDWMLEDRGEALLFSPLGSYVDHDHEAIREMLVHPASVVGLGDGGAHCGLICDASFPTYLLTHWVRDRSRGDRLPIELVVHKQTQATALAYGFEDRGVLAPGMLGDVNVIDLDGLTLHVPHMVNDLPAGGRRLLQNVDGYLFTVKAGEVVSEGGELTGARPGRTVVATDHGMERR